MPSTTDKRAARWPDGDREAMVFLQEQGWKLNRQYLWEKEGVTAVSAREADAIMYLIQEWDFGTNYPDPLAVMIGEQWHLQDQQDSEEA